MTVTSTVAGGPSDARREELRRLLLECDVDSDQELDDRTPLISSGILGSLALFQVALWVEKQIGRPINPNAFDLAEEWDSIEAILDFIARATGGNVIASASRGAHASLRTSRWGIVQYTSADKHAVATLQKSVWSGDLQRHLRYLEWKYERNPCPTGSPIFLALDRDEVIGMRGFYASRWESRCFEGADLLVADDLVIHDRYRNQDVTNQIMREALRSLSAQGIDYVFNFSGGVVTVLNSLAAGWRSIGAVEPVQRTSPLNQLRDRARRFVASAPYLWRYTSSPQLFSRAERDPFLRIDRLLETTVSIRGVPVRISRVPEPDNMASLIRGTPHDGRIRVVRDASYLRWRFANPMHDYRYFYLDGDALGGYLVVKRTVPIAEPNPIVHIVDLEANDDQSRLVLLEAAANGAFFDALVVWSATLTSECRRFLATINFAPAPTSSALQGHPCLLVRSTAETRLKDDWNLHDLSLTDLKNWDMRMIYTMAG